MKKRKSKPTIYKRYKLGKDQIIFDIPLTVPELKAVDKPILVVPPKTPTPYFTPLDDPVGNIAIEEVDKPGTFLIHLPRKVRIKVHYTASVFTKAKDKPLVLAIWDGTGWVLLNAPQYHYKLFNYKISARGGYAILTTKIWWDPPMVWGT
jgi:hypothetical protein